MNKCFKDFDHEIRLTASQREDAKRKYDNVCKTVHKKYYSDIKYDGSTKFLFGSYKLNTNIRPITLDQDVDVLFKIPREVYERFDDYDSNGQSALLDEIRKELQKRFSTTEAIKAWGKVILVQFSDGHHNIELLPAYERKDKTFEIPNTEDGGRWEIFDPRSRINQINQSDEDSDGYTKQLIRAIKRWRNNVATLKLESYNIEDSVIAYIDSNPSYTSLDLSERILEFFKCIKVQIRDSSNLSHIETAISRAEKAIDYEKDERLRKASEEWRKIFGDEFPLLNDPNNEPRKESDRSIQEPHRPYLAYI